MTRLPRWLALLTLSAAAAAAADLTAEVDPWIGTATANPTAGPKSAVGDVFPGAIVPRGMVEWSPDTPSNLPGGYLYSDHAIKGFSLRHFSGRGCDAEQDFAFLPLTAPPSAPPSEANRRLEVGFDHRDEAGSPGFYGVKLADGIQVGLTATARTGMASFEFPAGSSPTVLIDGASSITGATERTAIRVVGSDGVEGWATARVGCGKELYTLYFSARFDRPFARADAWTGEAYTPGVKAGQGKRCGVRLTFDPAQGMKVQAKIGLSFVSVANAEANLAAENAGWSFAETRARAQAAWNERLGQIAVDGGTAAQRRAFYTAVYHVYFHPNVCSDVNGDYLGMDGKVHQVEAGHAQYENIPGWDCYRSAMPLAAVLQPKETSDIMASLLRWADQGGGGLPRWQQANHNTAGMVGDGPVIMLAAAHAFGADGFDAHQALADAERDAGAAGTKSDGHTVRDALAEYQKLGYVPGRVSVTQEYASADFAVSRLAAALGDSAAEAKFRAQSNGWPVLYNRQFGVLLPKNADGAWTAGGSAASHKGFTEGSAAQYVWMVPFDLPRLFQLMGGEAEAVKRLDVFFTKLNESAKGNGLYANMGNEPDEIAPWVYDFAGVPAKTQAIVRRIQNELFTDKPNGLPGNDDAGAMSSWLVFADLGLYPAIPGEGGFVVGSPLFARATVHLPRGDLVITGNGAATDAPYVQSLSLNGSPWTSTWIPWSKLSGGAKLDFALGPGASDWGKGAEHAPPQFPAPQR